MRISDWSSDVCSSDLREEHRRAEADEDELRDDEQEAVHIDEEPEQPPRGRHQPPGDKREPAPAPPREPAAERPGPGRTEVRGPPGDPRERRREAEPPPGPDPGLPQHRAQDGYRARPPPTRNAQG